jgi:hypothetical protein
MSISEATSPPKMIQLPDRSADQSRLESIRDIAAHIIWINALGLNTFLYGKSGFEKPPPSFFDQYNALLTPEELSFAERIDDLYQPRMKTFILEYVNTLTPEDIVAFITDQKLSLYYADIIQMELSQFDFFYQMDAADEKDSSLTIPSIYSWCDSYPYYKAIFHQDWRSKQDYIRAIQTVFEGLRDGVGRAATASHLTAQQLSILKMKMEEFEKVYPVFHGRYPGYWKAHLINTKSETWWCVSSETRIRGVANMVQETRLGPRGRLRRIK